MAAYVASQKCFRCTGVRGGDVKVEIVTSGTAELDAPHPLAVKETSTHFS